MIGTTIITPFSGYLTDRLGRKLSIILCCIPYAFGWLTVVLTVSTDGPAFRPLLFIGRFVVGVAAGWSAACFNVSPYLVMLASIVYPQETIEQFGNIYCFSRNWLSSGPCCLMIILKTFYAAKITFLNISQSSIK